VVEEVVEEVVVEAVVTFGEEEQQFCVQHTSIPSIFREPLHPDEHLSE
jgi:hypothetical protein